MFRIWMIAVCLVLSGCGEKPGRMEHPEDPLGRYREQIAVAARVLAQNESWADRAEWEVLKSGDGWRVVAWRIEYPDRKGPDRYLPWGYSVIELDSRMEAMSYRAKN
jgi:hypothetical protein